MFICFYDLKFKYKQSISKTCVQILQITKFNATICIELQAVSQAFVVVYNYLQNNQVSKKHATQVICATPKETFPIQFQGVSYLQSAFGGFLASICDI